jgi:biopolymer transport protein ExbD
MAKIKRRQSRGIQGADLTPMIDVVFLLLVFFMVATSFVEETQQYNVELPKAEDAEVAKIDDVLSVIILKYEEGDRSLDPPLFRIGNEAISRKVLYDRLEKETTARELSAVIIKADKNARYQDIISVVSCLHALDIPDFSLAVLGE